MLKQALRSYLVAIHPRNVKQIRERGQGIFWMIYWLFLYPLIINGANDENGEPGIAFYFVKFLPLMLMFWSNITSKFMMPKIMYLCPMTYEDRKKYVHSVLTVKIGIPVLLGLVLELIWGYFKGYNPWLIALTVFLNISLGIGTYICIEGQGSADRPIRFGKKAQNKIKTAWMNVAIVVFVIFLIFGLEYGDLTEDMTLLSGIVIGVLGGLILLFDIMIVVTQYQATIESAGDYESNFHILGRVPEKDNRVELDFGTRG